MAYSPYMWANDPISDRPEELPEGYSPRPIGAPTSASQLRKYFVADDSKRVINKKSDAAIRRLVDAYPDKFNYNDEVKRAIVVNWMSARTKTARSYVANNWDALSHEYFGGANPLTPSQAYDRITENYDNADELVATVNTNINRVELDKAKESERSWVENAARSVGAAFGKGLGLERVAAGGSRMAIDTAATPFAPTSGLQLMPTFGEKVTDPKDRAVLEAGRKELTRFPEMIERHMQNVDDAFGVSDDFKQSISGQVISGVGEMPAIIMAGMVDPAVLVSSLASMNYGGAIEDYKDTMAASGKEYNPDVAAASALMSTALQTPLDMIVPGRFVKRILGTSAKMPVGGFIKKAATFLGDAGWEGGTEGAQQWLGDAVARVGYDKERDVLSGEEWQRVFNAGFVGTLSGGISSAGVSMAMPKPTEADLKAFMDKLRDEITVTEPPWTWEDRTIPSKEDFNALNKLPDSQILSLDDDAVRAQMLLSAARGDETSQEAYRSIVAQHIQQDVVTSDIIEDGVRKAVNASRSPDAVATVSNPTPAFTNAADRAEFAANVAKALERFHADEGESEAKAMPDEDGTVRYTESDLIQAERPDIRAAAKKLSDEALTKTDEAIVWQLVARAISNTRSRRKDLRLMKQLATSEHRILFEKYYGQMKLGEQRERLFAKFDKEISAMRVAQAQKLANMKSHIEEANHQRLEQLRRRRDYWRDMRRTDIAINKWVKQQSRIVEELLPMSERGRVVSMKPTEVDLRTAKNAEAFLDRYLDKAVEVEENYRKKVMRSRLEDFIKTRETQIGKATRGKTKVNRNAAAFSAYLERLRSERVDGDDPNPRLSDDMSSDQLAALLGQLKNVWAEGRDLQAQREEAEAKAIHDIMQSVAVEMLPGNEDNRSGIADSFRRMRQKLGASFGLTQYQTDMVIATGRRNSTATQLVTDSVNKATLDNFVANQQWKDFRAGALKSHGVETFDWSAYMIGRDGKPFTINGKRLRMSEALTWYCYGKNAKARADLLGTNERAGTMWNGQAISDVDYEASMKALPENLKALGDDIMQWNGGDIFSRMSDMHERIYGMPLIHEDNYLSMRIVDTPSGALEEMRRLGRPSSMKARTGAVLGFKEDSMDFWKLQDGFVTMTNRFLSFHEKIQNLRRVFGDERVEQEAGDGRVAVRNQVKDRLDAIDPTISKELFKYLEDIERGGDGKTVDDWEKWIDVMRRNGYVAVFGFNPGSAVKVLASYGSGMRLVRPAFLAQASGECATKFISINKMMHELAIDPSVKHRNVVYDNNVFESKSYKALNKFRQTSFCMFRAADELSCTSLWYGKYLEGIADNLSQTDAIKAADKVVVDTQQSWDIKDLPRAYRSSGVFRKFLLQFTNDSMHAYNQFRQDIALTDGMHGWKDYAGLARVVAMASKDGLALFAWPAIWLTIGDLVNRIIRDGLDEAQSNVFGTQTRRKQDFYDFMVGDAMWNGLTTPTQGVPVLNQFTQYLVQRYVEGIPYKGDPLDSFSPMVVDSFRRSAMASTAMQALGIPGSNIAGAFLDKPIKEALK